MTLFRALPVWRGDTFLLKSRRGTYLVDGGELSSGLPRMLRERRVGNIRAAVCTFPSSERLGGILDLLADGYPLRECWFPARLGIVQGMADRFNGDWQGWMSLLGISVPHGFRPPRLSGSSAQNSAAMLMGLAAAALPNGPLFVSTRSTSPGEYVTALLEGVVLRSSAGSGKRNSGLILQHLGRGLMKCNGFRDLASLCCGLLLDEAGGRPKKDTNARVVSGLALTAMTAVLTMGGPRVRHFRRCIEPQHHLIPRHPVMCLNGVEVSPDIFLPDSVEPKQLFREVEKLFGYGRGLVFQYGNGECNALFCGNSRLLFAGNGNGIPLRRPSVITAPGHGGVALEAAYARIRSENPEQDIWVRAHYSHARKVSDSYRRLPNRLCLNDSTFRSVQEVVLEFGHGRWHRISGRFCTCA